MSGIKTIEMSQKSAERFQRAVDSYLAGNTTLDNKLDLLELGTMIDTILLQFYREESEQRKGLLKGFNLGDYVEIIDTARRRYIGRIFEFKCEFVDLECDSSHMVTIPIKNIISVEVL